MPFKDYIENNLIEINMGVGKVGRLESELPNNTEIVRQLFKDSGEYYKVVIRYPMRRLVVISNQEIYDIGKIDIFESLFDYLDVNNLSMEERINPQHILGLVDNKDDVYGSIKGWDITNLEILYYMNAMLLSEDIKYPIEKGKQGRQKFIKEFREYTNYF